jgi:hypothetical protein
LDIKINARETYANRCVLIDGMYRQAKTLHAPIICSFEDCEMWEILTSVDTYPALSYLKIVSNEVATSMIEREVDMKSYYKLIGRNVNFRKNDSSSIWRHANPEMYIDRANSNIEYQALYDLINEKTKNCFVYVTHDVMTNPIVFFGAIPNVCVLWSRRHPVYVAHSWLVKNWGDRHGKDPIALALTFSVDQGEPVPWHAVEWVDEWNSINPTERIVRSYEYLMTLEKKNYSKYKKKYSITPVFFEHSVIDKNRYLEKLELITGKKPSNDTAKICEREMVPRVLDKGDFKEKLKNLRSKISKKYINILDDISEEYEQDFLGNEGLSFDSLY